MAITGVPGTMIRVGDPLTLAAVRQHHKLTPSIFSYTGGTDPRTFNNSTFTRATVATYTDSGGLIQTAASGVPRYQHYVSGVPTFYVENGRTNSALFSEDGTNAAWTSTLGTSLAMTSVGPDGVTNSGVTMTEDAGNTNHRTIHSSIAFTANTKQSFSVFVKAGSRSKCGFLVDGNATGQFGADLNLATGAISEFHAGAGSAAPSVVRAVAFGNSWYRIEITGICDATSTAANCYLFMFDGASSLASRTYQGNGTGTVSWFGFMQEKDQVFPSSYIKTTTVAVTRNQDQWSAPYNFAPGSCTLLHDAYQYAIPSVNSETNLLTIGTTLPNNGTQKCFLYRYSDFVGALGVHNQNGVGQAVTSTPSGLALVSGDRLEYVGAFTTNGAAQAYAAKNGGAMQTGTITADLAFSAAFETPNMYMGQGNDTVDAPFFALRRLALVPGFHNLNEMRVTR